MGPRAGRHRAPRGLAYYGRGVLWRPWRSMGISRGNRMFPRPGTRPRAIERQTNRVGVLWRQGVLVRVLAGGQTPPPDRPRAKAEPVRLDLQGALGPLQGPVADAGLPG